MTYSNQGSSVSCPTFDMNTSPIQRNTYFYRKGFYAELYRIRSSTPLQYKVERRNCVKTHLQASSSSLITLDDNSFLALLKQ